MEWYLKCIKENYANFNGRARRKEYWMFSLFNMIAIFVIQILGIILYSVTGSETVATIFSLIYLLYALAVFIPSIAVAVRRLHDTNRSGWMLLIAFIPFVGSIILIVFLCIDSTPGDNQYGANPKLFR